MAKRFLATVGLLLACATLAAAQGTTSRLVGTVTDATLAPCSRLSATSSNEGTVLLAR